MKYLLLVLILATITGLEVYHELASHDASAAPVCMAPEGKVESARDALLAHLRSH